LFLPFRDHNPTKHFPIVTISLIALNVVIFGYMFLLQHENHNFMMQYAFLPRDLTKFSLDFGENFRIIGTMFTSMFLHGSVSHVIGNMLFLSIFGNNIEDIMGPIKFIIFYCVCGIVACLAQGIPSLGNASADIPMIGASGAISGVLGAYLIKFPYAKVDTCIVVVLVRLPAFLVLISWFFIQLLHLGALQNIEQSDIAYLAHIGGFICGMLLVNRFVNKPKRRKRDKGANEVIHY